ncbi:NAD(P)-binding domain-containing protein [Streptomyces sp. HUAS TT20]|uniref:NAD(P)-binding domain-containing protein n=1 Tax=Streptomyces sp. HUAS TT20 TaxID=3447509 RepID=UPI0021DA8D05|nr:NAD(P)-binding domain-containing protein [Streptomyces sp. HUAS 15-9]UXY30459.1 NAD(P)-binding domain-containing protein [Streptomyces sp. HUAS 15-9]
METDSNCAVVGSGLFGIQAVRELTRRGISVDWYSSDPEPGGIWQPMPWGKTRESTELVNPGWCIAPEFRTKPTVTVQEFRALLKSWSDERTNLQRRRFLTRVDSVVEHDSHVRVTTPDSETSYAFVVVATGRYGAPRIPDEWRDNCYHASSLQDLSCIQPHESVLVIGGGQSGVELCEEIIEDRPDIRLSWCTGRKVRLISRHSPLAMLGTCVRYSTKDEAPRGFVITKSPSMVSTRCKITPTRVLQVDGGRVEFSDGSIQKFDRIIAATGYASPVGFDFPAPNPGRTKGMRLSPRSRIASLNHDGDGCGGASMTCARKQAAAAARLYADLGSPEKSPA